MRDIKYIVIHCTATPQDTSVKSIQKYWREEKNWKNPGYHFLIEPSGYIHDLLPIEEISNGVQFYNSESINIAYIGGIDENGKAIDNRTEEQKKAMKYLIVSFSSEFPSAIIRGHREFPNVKKDCPSFDVKKWLENER